MKIRVVDGIVTGSPQSFSPDAVLSDEWKEYQPLADDFDGLRYVPVDRYDEENELVVQELEDNPDYQTILQVEIRVKRNGLLEESDWTQYTDSPLTEEVKEEWKVYRQELRDWPEVISDISSLEEIVWPQKPS